MSTKKQVSRKRQVIEVPKPERRDPRFSSVSAGHANADLHSKSYSFLPDLLRQEFSGLKEAVAAAKKAEKNCSWAEKPMKTAERERFEVQMGQVRTKLVRTEKESMEREILAKAKKEEREKRTQGKGAWYMKKGESPECRCIFKLTGNQQARKKTCFSKRVSRHSRNKGEDSGQKACGEEEEEACEQGEKESALCERSRGNGPRYQKTKNRLNIIIIDILLSFCTHQILLATSTWPTMHVHRLPVTNT